ncbi:DUF4465 domain-containing protein [Prevotella sp. AGR2160]|uniref:DUF4465 domain-containing protein n=1 Tax=Prevotella sp. AGR2160 TaxID=1280674 RepID=UPI00040B8C07|nr:DUF4465 domain-containing protein [Prevotella sp. AGR2160]
MKKFFTLILFCLAVVTASAQNYSLRTLTFEDGDYKSTNANYLNKFNWSSLIDTVQYGGELLYGENHGDTSKSSTAVNYSWYDENNTNLYSELPENWGTKMHWGGGQAISNYWNGNLSDGNYLHQLSVYVADNTGNGQKGHGHNGSDNFCVDYGYKDNSGYSASNLPFFEFKDGVARTIDHMWINNTTYFVNVAKNGNSLSSALADTDYVKVEAIGYHADGTTKTTSTYLALGKKFLLTDWTNWSLANLGKVTKVEFNIVGNTDNGYGFSLPAYFCYDDVAVRFPSDETFSAKVLKADESSTEKSFKVTLDNGECYQNGDVPEGATFTYDGPNTDTWRLLEEGQSCTFTIGSLPNINITKLEVDGYCEGAWGKADCEAKVGDTVIATKKWSGLFVDEYGESIGQTETTMTMDMPVSPIENVTKLDFVNTCVAKDMNVVSYTIYYTTNSSTAITTVNAASAGNSAYYDLQGRRVNNPTKGLYIHNGKKVIVK